MPPDYNYVRVFAMLKTLKKDVDSALKSALKDLSGELDLKPIPPLLYAAIKDFIERDGKRIRPILFLISYKGYTKRKNFSYKGLLKSSLSVELLHDFLLIHDDVIDKSGLRRGKPTLQRLFNAKLGMPKGSDLGENLSIVAGDVLFAMAVKSLLSLKEDPARKEEALTAFIKAASATGVGEYIDVVNNIKRIETLSRKDIFQTYILKTAKYTFQCPLVMGAVLAGAKKSEINKLSRLGVFLGQAFQLQDDMLDVFSSARKIGKPVLSDLNEGKKTLLVWKTYQNLKGKDKKKLKNLLEKKKKSYKDLAAFRKMIKSSGSYEYCAGITRSLLKEASCLSKKLKMKKEYKSLLEELIRRIAA